MFNPAVPEFRSAVRVAAPRGCGLDGAIWVGDGLVAGELCGTSSDVVRRLVRVRPSGRITAAWPMPNCVSDLSAAADPGRSRLALVLHVGVGGGPCGRLWADRLAVLDLNRPGVPPRILQDRRLRFATSELDVAAW